MRYIRLSLVDTQYNGYDALRQWEIDEGLGVGEAKSNIGQKD